MLRATKNRFGPVDELGFFAMSASGLREVRNPSAIFLARSPEPVPGSLVMVARDGGRPLLIEVQALVDRTRFATPRRVAQGVDANRLAMLLAVMSRHSGVALADHDVYVNLVGGLQISETATDLPLALALASSLRGVALDAHMVAFGELGLTGEVRPVPHGEERLRELHKHGYTRAILPRANAPRAGVDGLRLEPVSTLAEAPRRLRILVLSARAELAPRCASQLPGIWPHAARVRIALSIVCSTSNSSGPIRSEVPGSGMSSSFSSSRPLSVFGPRSGSCQPSDRLSARIVAPAIDEPGAAGLAVHVLVAEAARVGGEFPDDLLEQVLERDQTLDVAVFVDDEGVAAAIALELRQLLHQRGAGRHEVGLARRRQLDQPLARERAAREFLRGALHVQDADQVVEFAVVDRQARVRRLSQPLEHILPLAGHVDPGDVLALDHDVLDRDALEIEDRQQHLPVARRYQRARFADHGAQFLGPQGLARRAGRRAARTGRGTRRPRGS